MTAKYTPTLARGCFRGRRWHDFSELWPDDSPEPRMCTVCKTPTVWKRPRKRGAATHPNCEGNIFDSVTPDLYLKVLFSVAGLLGAAMLVEEQPSPVADKPKRLGKADAGCEICGRGYAALWIAAKTWRCAKHPPTDEHYRRSRHAG